MAGCAASPPGAGFVSAITSYIDCQAETLGTGAWSALSAPGSTLATVLTGFLTLFIALIGYNLLLGRAMNVRDGTLAFVKIGAVFALATSWPAYRTLVYDLVTDGPAQLVAEIGPSGGVVGSDGTMLQRLDLADQALAQLAMLGAGMPTAGSAMQAPPPPFGGFDAFALGGSRILFLLTAITGFGIVRIAAGLLLALGPFFIAFLLFDATRSLFEGWVRGLAGAALAAIGLSVALGLQLALLEPWLSQVLTRRLAGEPLPTMPTELFVVVMLFTMIVAASLYVSARVARAFRLPLVLRPSAADVSHPDQSRTSATGTESVRISEAQSERTRAAAIAALMSTTSRREGLATWAGERSPFDTVRPSTAHRGDGVASAPRTVGRSFARRTASRVSARANRRDATS